MLGRVEMLPNSTRIIPEREFLNRNSVSRLINLPNSVGIEPERLAPAISRYLSSLILPNCHGMLPCMEDADGDHNDGDEESKKGYDGKIIHAFG
ncbi:hypothetical protein L1987_01948 [Smallanthus sonchifolius]|uniref:Uncharacterized protein n=1 Tax=Smallanthus sonchifolius TaxID=185202 RepID=A0ACB9K6M8_9ASTR|nr:hypothetical protein L1987_01948 [Smallanthus sonchifolius]